MNESAEAIIRHSLALHSNIVGINSDGIVTLLQITPPTSQGRTASQQHVQQFTVMQNAAQHIMLSLYRNQTMHVFLRPALISLAINSCKEEELSLGEQYCFLSALTLQASTTAVNWILACRLFCLLNSLLDWRVIFFFFYSRAPHFTLVMDKTNKHTDSDPVYKPCGGIYAMTAVIQCFAYAL